MFSSVIQRSSRLFTTKQETILSAAFVIGAIFALAAFLGFIRNRLLSGYFGDAPELGLFFASDDMPSLIFSIIVSGSLSAAFIPVFTRVQKESQEKAWEFMSVVMNISLVLMLIAVVLIWIFSDSLVTQVLARGTSLTAAEMHLMAQMIRLMMVAQIIFIFSAFFTSVLQSFQHFVIPAFAPVAYNAGQIIFLICFVRYLGIFAPVYGMIFGSFLHFGLQLPFVKKLGYRHLNRIDLRNRHVREVYLLLLPRVLSQLAYRLLIPLYTNLALVISASANVVLTFADDIQALPVRLFGMSIGQAALPFLSRTFNEKNISEYRVLLIKTIHQVSFFILPVSIVMFVLKIPLIRIAVGAQKYSWESTVMTAYTLGFFAISLFAQALIIVLSRSFYSLRNTRTPFFLSTFAILLNAIIAIYFVRYMHLGVWSLALATLISVTIHAVLLVIFLSPLIDGFDWELLMTPLVKIGGATLITGIALYVPFRAMDQVVFNTTRTVWLVALTAVVSGIGGITYICLCRVLRIEEYAMVIDVVEKIRDRGMKRFLKRQSVLQ